MKIPILLSTVYFQKEKKLALLDVNLDELSELLSIQWKDIST